MKFNTSRGEDWIEIKGVEDDVEGKKVNRRIYIGGVGEIKKYSKGIKDAYKEVVGK